MIPIAVGVVFGEGLRILSCLTSDVFLLSCSRLPIRSFGSAIGYVINGFGGFLGEVH
jgi:hypothetical protein